MSADSKAAFSVFRPLCVEISRSQDLKFIRKLKKTAEQYPSDVIQDLHEYLLFPLRIAAQRGVAKEDVIIEATMCIKSIFCKIEVSSFALHKDVLKALLLLISEVQSGLIQPTGSEELKQAVFQCLHALIDHSTKTLWKNFYCSHSIPILGHLVTLCLSVASQEENRLIRVSAMSVLQSLVDPSYKSDLIAEDSDLLTVMSGDCLASFLPGILCTFVKVLLGDVKQGHAVKCKAFEVTASALQTIVGDHALALASSKTVQESLKSITDASANDRVASVKVTRDKKWLNDVSPKINVLLQEVTAVSENPSVLVRLSLIQFCKNVFVACCQSSLPMSIPILLSGIVQLLFDEQPQVCTESKKAIDRLSSLLENKLSVTDVLEDSCFTLCSHLPTVLKKNSDNEKLKTLKLLCGYLAVFKQKLKLSSLCLDKLIEALLFCFQLNSSNLFKIEDVSPLPAGSDLHDENIYYGYISNWQFQKCFVHFQDQRILKILIQICRLLGCHGDLPMLTSSLLHHYENETVRQQAVMIINEVLLGVSHDTEEQVTHLLKVYLSPASWYLTTSHESGYIEASNKKHLTLPENVISSRPYIEGPTYISPKTVNDNIILTCLHLEAISTFSSVLGQGFRNKLILTLYPVLEKASDHNYLISSCGLKTLHAIAENCDYQNAADLINKNADYLVNEISLNLRALQLHPRCPAVLQTMLSQSNAEIFPLVRDTIDEILDTLDAHQVEHHHLVSILPVLLAIVQFVNQWLQSTNAKEMRSFDLQQNEDKLVIERSKKDLVFEIKAIISEYHENKTCFESFDNASDSGISQDSEDSVVDDRSDEIFHDETVISPAEIQVSEQILKRCCHLLANSNPKTRLLTMKIIQEGICALTGHEDTLLPLVHQLWAPLMARFTDSELQVVTRGFEVICELARISGDFIRRKFNKDVFPKLISFLKKHRKESASKSCDSMLAFRHSTVFKLLKNILSRLGPLLRNVPIGYEDLHLLMEVTLPYLSSAAAQDLQTAAMALFENLVEVDRDAVWLFLSDIYTSETIIQPPSAKLKAVYVAGSRDLANEYAANITSLLPLCG